jgi:hypothetical protein
MSGKELLLHKWLIRFSSMLLHTYSGYRVPKSGMSVNVNSKGFCLNVSLNNTVNCKDYMVLEKGCESQKVMIHLNWRTE